MGGDEVGLDRERPTDAALGVGERLLIKIHGGQAGERRSVLDVLGERGPEVALGGLELALGPGQARERLVRRGVAGVALDRLLEPAARAGDVAREPRAQAGSPLRARGLAHAGVERGAGPRR